MSPRLAEALRQLKRVYPLIAPVRILIAPRLKDEGEIWWYSRPRTGRPVRFNIVLRARTKREPLVHEWAHALRWRDATPGVEMPHNRAWGAVYSDCYSLIFDEETP